ncbi:MAG TPA: putative Ig domain-containing protein, partial [Roseimicrobium sp.]|nr:putative Ig domain-containing protein [Roseimicrobium sp.]
SAPVFLTPSLLDYQKIEYGGKNIRAQFMYPSFQDNPNVNLGGVPFNYGPAGGNNSWDARYTPTQTNPLVLEVPVSVPFAERVETLINTAWGRTGGPYAYIEFIGTNGAYYRKDLYGNADIRDFNSNFHTNFINNTTTTLVYAQGLSRMDKQSTALPDIFRTESLQLIRFVDVGAISFQRIFMHGLSILAPDGHDGAVIQAGRPFTYRFSAQDAEEADITYTMVNGPSGAVIDSTTGVFLWTPPAGTTGWHSVALRVSDGKGGQDDLSLTLRVQAAVANYAPRITSKPVTNVRYGTTYRSNVDVFDPNGDPVSIRLIQSPTGMALIQRESPATSRGDSAFISWTPAPNQLGSHPVTVEVTDGRSAPVTQSFTVQVLGTNSNAAPVIVSAPPLVAVVGRRYSYDIAANDADHDPLLYRTVPEVLPRGVSLHSLRGAVRWTPAEDQIGIHRMQVEVTDQQGGLVTQEWEVRVQGANQPPLFTSLPPTESAVNTTYTYPVKAADPEGDKLRYSLVAAPAYMIIDPTTGVIQWRPPPMPRRRR